MRAFQSVVPVSIMDFYESIGVTRDVASRPDLSYYALRGLFSVKYYFDQVDVSNAITETPELDLPGFVYEETENGFRRFRNTAYIPMGFTFDQYISEDVWDATSESQRCPLLIRALVLSDEQVEKYGDWMKPITSQDLRMTEDEYLTECSERAASACDTFTYDPTDFRHPLPRKSRIWYSSACPTRTAGLPRSTARKFLWKRWTRDSWRSLWKPAKATSYSPMKHPDCVPVCGFRWAV